VDYLNESRNCKTAFTNEKLSYNLLFHPGVPFFKNMDPHIWGFTLFLRMYIDMYARFLKRNRVFKHPVCVESYTKF
jgi:hypothetical protein